MSTVALTMDSFEDTVTKPGITLVDWWASWCGPCRMFAPVFGAASDKHPDITFGKVEFAHQALDIDRSIGLLLPRNVVVRAGSDGTIVGALDPQVMVTLTGRAELKPVADEVARRLAAALAGLTS